MKNKNHIFKFNKKSPKTTKTIELNNPKFSNDYSKIICEILNIKINKSIDRYTISNKPKYNYKYINKISPSINNSIQVLKKVKPKKFIIELNSPKKDNKKIMNINDTSNDAIQRVKRTHALNQSSLIMNMNMNTNFKKNRRFFQSNSERNVFKSTNCHKVLTSLNKNLKININLCNQNNINLIKKQISFNNKGANKENKSNEKKAKDSEDHKDKTFSILYNYDGILRQKSSNEKMIKMNYEVNHTNNSNSKIIIKKCHKKKNTEVYNLDKILIKMNKKGINSIRKDLNPRKVNTKMKLNNKKIIICKSDISPFKVKTKSLNKKFKRNNNYTDISENKSRNSINNNSFSKVCSNNITHYNHHFLHINGIKTEFIELNLTNNNKSFIYDNKKKIESDLIINDKNNLTLREEHIQRNNNENNKTPMKISHSYKTVFIHSKKTRSLSRKRDEMKIKNILKLSEMSDEEKPENKMSYLLKSLENEKINLKSRKNFGLKSEPKKLIDRIRKVIKIKNYNL